MYMHVNTSACAYGQALTSLIKHRYHHGPLSALPPHTRGGRVGQKLDIKIVRTDLSRGFGFGLASKFRIEGRAKVISFVDPKGPAAAVLRIGDEILAVCEVGPSHT
jgi:predicted metalloprotease with PDZ domain